MWRASCRPNRSRIPQGIDGSFGYLNYFGLESNGGNALLFTGNNCGGETCYSPRTPKYTGALGAQYSFVLGDGARLTPRLDATYQSTIYFAANNGCLGSFTPQGCGQTDNQNGYALLNGRLTYDTANKKWQASLWGRNLTDKEYFYGKLSLITFFGREQGNPAPPREWGVTVQRKF